MSGSDFSGFWDNNFGSPKVQRDKDYKNMFVRELKSDLKKRKLPITGVKSTLVNRLKTEDNLGYGMLTVPELKKRMKSEGLDVSGDKSTLKSRMRAKLLSRGYEFLPINDLRQLSKERGLNLPKKNSTGQKSTLIGRLTKADTAKVTTSTSYSPSPSTDSSPVVMTVIGGVIAFMLVLGCIGMMDTEEEDSYSSSSGGSSGSSSGGSWNNDCFGGDAENRWCPDVELDVCVYHDTSSGNWYYQELHWYGC